jgi:hypothetical protein
MSRVVGRRNFLKTAAYGAVTAPVAVGLSSLGWAQTTKPAASHAAAPKPAAAHTGPTVTLNVKDYGAAGDGKTNDTLALQLTIERCAVLGGGEVVVPAGDYATGALALRSNVTLRIEDGASLLGSGDMADYPIAQVRWEGRWIKGLFPRRTQRTSASRGQERLLPATPSVGVSTARQACGCRRCWNSRTAAMCAWRTALPSRPVCGRRIPCIAKT